MFKSLAVSLLLLVLPLTAGAQIKKDAPTVLITGANRGIGLELAKQYAAKGWNVIATTRHPEGDPGRAALNEVHAKHPQLVVERLDVTDTAMIRGVQQKYHDLPMDVVINNAAAVEATFAADMANAGLKYDKVDFDAARHDFDVNTLGPMRVAQVFMPNIEMSKQKKLVTVTSLAGSFTRGLPGDTALNYSASKAALNKYMTLLAITMKPKGVIVALTQPIFVASKSDLANMKGAAPVDQEVGKLVKLIDSMTMAHTGKITNFSTGETDPF